MKKIGAIIFILIFFLVFGNLIIKADLISDANSGIQKVENIQNEISNLKDTNSSYLGEQWKNNLLKNKFVSSVDSSLQKISIIFEILLGEKYIFSISFFLMILVWIYLLFNLSYLMKTFFSGGISWAISFLILLIFARVHFFAKVIFWMENLFLVLGKFIKFLPLLILTFIILILILFYFFESTFRMFAAWYLKKMRRLKDQQRKIDETLLHTTVQGMIGVWNKK